MAISRRSPTALERNGGFWIEGAPLPDRDLLYRAGRSLRSVFSGGSERGEPPSSFVEASSRSSAQPTLHEAASICPVDIAV